MHLENVIMLTDLLFKIYRLWHGFSEYRVYSELHLLISKSGKTLFLLKCNCYYKFAQNDH